MLECFNTFVILAIVSSLNKEGVGLRLKVLPGSGIKLGFNNIILTSLCFLVLLLRKMRLLPIYEMI